MKTTVKIVSVTALKARLSEYLRRVKAGEAVTITERGRPIAVMEPLSDVNSEVEMADLLELGLVRRSRRALPDDFWERPRPADPECKVREALLEERRAGR